MAKLSEEEKREFLEDGKSDTRRRDFGVLRRRQMEVALSPSDFINGSQRLMNEKITARPPIKGDVFKL